MVILLDVMSFLICGTGMPSRLNLCGIGDVGPDSVEERKYLLLAFFETSCDTSLSKIKSCCMRRMLCSAWIFERGLIMMTGSNFF